MPVSKQIKNILIINLVRTYFIKSGQTTEGHEVTTVQKQWNSRQLDSSTKTTFVNLFAVTEIHSLAVEELLVLCDVTV